MKKIFLFYKIIFISICGMILFQSCSTEKSGPHATAVIQFANDSEAVSLLSSTPLLITSLKKMGQATTEENLEDVRKHFQAKVGKTTPVILVFYSDDEQFSVAFLDTFIRCLDEEIMMKKKRSANQQISFLDSLIKKSAEELSYMEKEVKQKNEQTFNGGLLRRKKVNSPNLEKHKRIKTEILMCGTDAEIIDNIKVMISKKEFDGIKFLSEMITGKAPSFDKRIESVFQLQKKINGLLLSKSSGAELDSLNGKMKTEQQKLIAFLDNEKKKYGEKKESLEKELSLIPPEKENDEMTDYMKLMHDFDFKERQHNSLIEKKTELSIVNAGYVPVIAVLSKPAYVIK